MMRGLSICRDWLEHLASSHQEGADPGATAKAIVDDCRPTMDRAEIISLTAELESQVTGLRFLIVSSNMISAHNWRLAVIQGAVRALKATERQ